MSATEAVQLPGTTLSFEARGRGFARWADERLLLRGEFRWIARGASEEIELLAGYLDRVSTRLDPGLLEINFGNAVGHFPLGPLGRIEVVSRKWSQAHFETMLSELTQIAASLPFAAGTQGALPYDRSLADHEDLLYHSFVYLRHALTRGDLLPALRALLHDPHRRPLRERHRTSPELARDLDPAGIARIAEGRMPLVPVAPAVAARIPLARALGGSMPRWVDELRVTQTVDTAENRFVKSFLDQMAGVIQRVETLTRNRIGRRKDGVPSSFQARLLEEAREMTQALAPIRRAGLWQSVGRMGHFPAGSTVLQRRDGYREVLVHFVRMRTATRLPIDVRRARQLLEIKDIAQLYELWTFYQVVDAVRVHLGAPQTARLYRADDWQVDAPQGMELRWASGARLWYNQSYSRSGPKGRRSYSLTLRPDIALWVPEGQNRGLHLLDAKFRVDRWGAGVDADADAEGGEAGEGDAAWTGKFKPVDLYKMHAYRDAIEGVRSVWILYPGSEMRFFGLDADGLTRVEKGSSAGVASARGIDGVGAIPLRPEDGGCGELGGVVEAILGG